MLVVHLAVFFSHYYSFRERTGGITFGDFMEFLSVISKGSTEDKLLWAFTFYDVNHDGVISKEEMLKVKRERKGLMASCKNEKKETEIERKSSLCPSTAKEERQFANYFLSSHFLISSCPRNF